MAKKFDFAVVKEYLKAKGERVGLAVACGLGALFLLLGIMSLGGKKPKGAASWDKEIDAKATNLKSKIADSGEEPKKPDPLDPSKAKWGYRPPVAFNPFILLAEDRDDRKRNP